jgi:hypothetical protein
MLAESPARFFYTGGFSGFVTSTTAPIATGWNEPVRGWELHPLWTKRLSRRTRTIPLIARRFLNSGLNPPQDHRWHWTPNSDSKLKAGTGTASAFWGSLPKLLLSIVPSGWQCFSTRKQSHLRSLVSSSRPPKATRLGSFTAYSSHEPELDAIVRIRRMPSGEIQSCVSSCSCQDDSISSAQPRSVIGVNPTARRWSNESILQHNTPVRPRAYIEASGHKLQGGVCKYGWKLAVMCIQKLPSKRGYRLNLLWRAT